MPKGIVTEGLSNAVLYTFSFDFMVVYLLSVGWFGHFYWARDSSVVGGVGCHRTRFQVSGLGFPTQAKSRRIAFRPVWER